MTQTSNVFSSNPFENAQIASTVVNELPYVPGSAINLLPWSIEAVANSTVQIDVQDGVLQLFANRPRGGGSQSASALPVRSSVPVNLAHYPVKDAVGADEIQNIRVSGSTDLTPYEVAVQRKFASIVRNMRLTMENHGIGAVKGEVLDSDGSTSVADYATLFGTAVRTDTFDFTGSLTMRDLEQTVMDNTEAGLEGAAHDGVVVFCGSDAFTKAQALYDGVVGSGGVRSREGDLLASLRTTERGFTYGDVTFVRYRNPSAGTSFNTVAATTMLAAPRVADMWRIYNGPANRIMDANGAPMIADPRENPEDLLWANTHMRSDMTGVDVDVEGNFLFVNARPGACTNITATVS